MANRCTHLHHSSPGTAVELWMLSQSPHQLSTDMSCEPGLHQTRKTIIRESGTGKIRTVSWVHTWCLQTSVLKFLLDAICYKGKV